MAQVIRRDLGLDALRRDNPWPEFPYGEIEPFYLPLDGGGTGGREIIAEVLVTGRVRLMLEIGCFLGGSSIQWFRTHDKLTIIGADVWDSNWGDYVEWLATDTNRARTVLHLTDERLASIGENIRTYGNFCIAMNNLRLYKKRFIPVRRRSPEVLHYLKDRGIEPQLIYIDADKKREDLDVVKKLYPDAIICGDDWLWPDETGRFVMQEHVKDFAREHGYEIRQARQTWLLIAPSSQPETAEKTTSA
jgi:hypothetical protein